MRYFSKLTTNLLLVAIVFLGVSVVPGQRISQKIIRSAVAQEPQPESASAASANSSDAVDFFDDPETLALPETATSNDESVNADKNANDDKNVNTDESVNPSANLALPSNNISGADETISTADQPAESPRQPVSAAKKMTAVEKAQSRRDDNTILTSLLPSDSLMTIRAASLKSLDQYGAALLSEAGFDKISPLTLLRWTRYGKTLSYVDLNRPAAIAYVAEESPTALVYLPVSQTEKFLQALEVSSEPLQQEKGAALLYEVPKKKLFVCLTPLDKPMLEKISSLSGTPGLSENLASTDGVPIQYGILIFSESRELAQKILNAPLSKPAVWATPSGLKNSLATLEVTPRGIEHFMMLGKSSLKDISPFVQHSLETLTQPTEPQAPELEQTEPEFTESQPTESIDLSQWLPKAAKSIDWIRENVLAFRLDLSVEKDSVILATSILPRPQSALQSQILDQSFPQTAVTFDLGLFLKVLPEMPSPIDGQMDLPVEVASKLEAPFNRIRHVEYSLANPAPQELLAESWAFFLEVDDADAFIQELIVPKAKQVGGFIGSEKASELGAQIMGNMAVRRQQRQSNRRRPPRRSADPNTAAQQGELIGSLLGGIIGESAGENQAMKKYDFEGYPLYISDLVLYAQTMKQIREKESGQTPPKPIVLTGEPSLRLILGNLISGLENGNLEGMAQNFLPGNGSQPDDAPLLARRNLILVLDKNHLLIVPGNEEILRQAKNNWEQIRPLYLPPQEGEDAPPLPTFPLERAADLSWMPLWDQLSRKIASPELHQLRSVARWDAVATQAELDGIRSLYAPELPRFVSINLPAETPKILCVSTATDAAGFFYLDVPNSWFKSLKQVWFAEIERKKEEK